MIEEIKILIEKNNRCDEDMTIVVCGGGEDEQSKILNMTCNKLI